MAAGTAAANGITLWYESFGDSADPALVLIMGVGLQALVWPTEFCARLAAGGRYVVRFDNRDTGLSTYFGDDANYTLEDMAGDVAGLLDALGIAQTHVSGFSMGGRVAQWMAVRHPERVLSLTSMASSPYTTAEAAGLPGLAAGVPGLSPDSQRFFAEYVSGPFPETREARIERGVAHWRALWGTAPFEEDEIRAREAEMVERAWRPEAVVLQQRAIDRSPSRVEGLKRLAIPTLVIHGTADPLTPPGYGEATAALIPGARLLLVEGMGHALPRACWGELVGAILQHTAP
jgi:pimeloyl-ACP methyl ester carboxylesterase